VARGSGNSSRVKSCFDMRPRVKAPRARAYTDCARLRGRRVPPPQSARTSARQLNRGMTFLFFQAEDGIRYWSVTGVQTCALPICSPDQDGFSRPLEPEHQRRMASGLVHFNEALVLGLKGAAETVLVRAAYWRAADGA